MQLDIVDASGQKVNTQQAISTALIKAALAELGLQKAAGGGV